VESSSRRYLPNLLVCLFLIVATLAVYWQVRGFEFINFDDSIYVVQNIHVRAGLTLDGLKWALTDQSTGHWHPLTWLSLMLDSQFFGTNAGGFHLTNVFFHIANALLVFWVFFRMTGARYRSAFVAALFALHPLHVESVAWVSERKDVLSTFFLLLTMWAYTGYAKESKYTKYGLALIFFMLGLLSKTMLVTLPFVLLLLDYWPLCRMQSPNISISRLVLEKIPFFALAMVSSILAIFTQQSARAVVPMGSLTLWERLANAFVSYCRYLGKMIFPKGLCIFYPYSWSLPIWEVLGSVLLITCISLFVIRSAKQRPWFVLGWCWFLGTLFPVLGLVQIGGQAMADRYSYVPLIGLFTAIAWSIPSPWPGKVSFSRYYQFLVSGLLGGVLVALGVASYFQVRHWQSSIALFEHALRVTTDNALAQNNLGIALGDQGKYPEAIQRFNEALRIEQNYAEARMNLGVVLGRQGKFRDAIEQYETALKIDPKLASAHNNLGIVYSSQGKAQAAIEQYKEALQVDPQLAEVHNNLGLVLSSQGKSQEAIEQYNEALQANPGYAEVHRNLGVVFASQGKIQGAAEEFTKALAIDPNNVDARINLGITLGKEGKLLAAIEVFTEILRGNPSDVDAAHAHVNIGVALGGQGKLQDSIEQFLEAIRIQPSYVDAHLNLGNAYLLVGNKEGASTEYNALTKLSPVLARELYKKINK
jgi:type IV pilus biogenesis/stability protein PilW